MIKPPSHWLRRLPTNPFFEAFRHSLVPLTVLSSRSTTRDEKQWIHVSVSHKNRIPTWAELSKVKDEFIGADKEAYQVLAAQKDHVNVHEFCLHLWSPLDGQRCVANLQDLINEEAP